MAEKDLEELKNKSKSDVSVIIPSKDFLVSLTNTVEALLLQELLPKEIIIIDSSKNNKNENYFKIREDKGFGILNNKADLIVPAIFNSLTLYNHKDQLLWIAERNLEELDYKVLAYINKEGRILFKQGFSSEEFLVNSCD